MGGEGRVTPTGSTAEVAARRDRIKWSLLVFAGAMLVRALAIGPLVGTPLLDTIMGDALNYEPWAREIAAGDWLGDRVFYQAPLYPYFLAAIFRLLGPELLVVRGVQIVLGSASCGLLALSGWHWFSKPVGIAAGVMLALYAPAIFADLTIQKSVLDLFFVCLILFGMGARADGPGRLGCVGLGAALGLLAVSRENALVFAPVIALWLGVLPAAPRGARAPARLALFSLGIALVLLPVAGRNAYVGGEFHLTTSQFGHNF